MNSINSECVPACEVACTQPYACSRSLEPCVASCGDSRAVVYAPPVVLTFPGPTLTSCSQESIVGTSIPQPYAALTQYGSDESNGMGGAIGSGGMSGRGVSFGAGGMSGMGSSIGARGSVGFGGMSGMGGSAGFGGFSGMGGSVGCGGLSGMGGGSFGNEGSFGFGGASGVGSCYSRQTYRSRRGSRLGNCSSF